MITFVLILVLLDSLQFGAEPTPKLRKVRVAAPAVQLAPAPERTTPRPSCFDSGNGETSCYPIDDSGKHYR